jgi:hypothetical protein
MRVEHRDHSGERRAACELRGRAECKRILQDIS